MMMMMMMMPAQSNRAQFTVNDRSFAVEQCQGFHTDSARAICPPSSQ